MNVSKEKLISTTFNNIDDDDDNIFFLEDQIRIFKWLLNDNVKTWVMAPENSALMSQE